MTPVPVPPALSQQDYLVQYRTALGKAIDEVRIGQKGSAEGNEVGRAGVIAGT